ncbi:MAG: hypothetical protein OER90_01040 [Gemmatimonadota bacterium]|nr:hypothetical protein [Gemmatimonadota bacterium]
MTPETLARRLVAEPILRLAPDESSEAHASWEVVERHPTGIAGELLIIDTLSGFAAIERPNATECVVRYLANPDEVQRFVDRRLGQYARMWDGCGCKIDYYG